MNIPQVVISDTVSLYLLTLLMEAQSKDIQREKEGIRLKQLICLTMLSSILDIVLTLIDGKEGAFWYLLNYYGNTVLFITPTLIAWCWLSFLCQFYLRMRDYRGRSPMESRLLKIPGVAALGAGTVQFFVPVLFRIDQNNVYHRMPLSWLSVGVAFFYIAAGIIIYYLRKAPAYFRTGNVWLFGFPILVGTLFQFMFYGVSVIFPSVTIGLTGFYISCHKEIMMRDTLTGLLNRTCFLSGQTQRLFSDSSNSGIIMLDVDRFKEINDKYGHLEGDRALKLVAGILKASVGDEDLIFRFGGDEFLILCQSRNTEHLSRVKEKILAEMQKFNESKKVPYPLTVSCGIAGSRENAGNLESALKAADFNMYSEKGCRGRDNQAVPFENKA